MAPPGGHREFANNTGGGCPTPSQRQGLPWCDRQAPHKAGRATGPKRLIGKEEIMSNALAEPTRNAEPERPVHRRPTALLIATDGTPQSDAAIALARLVPPGNRRNV